MRNDIGGATEKRLHPNQWTPQALATLESAWKAGVSGRAIASTYDGQLDGGRRLTPEIVEKLRHRHKWPTRATGARPKPKPRHCGPMVAAAAMPDYGVTAGARTDPLNAPSKSGKLYSARGVIFKARLDDPYEPQVSASAGVSIMALGAAMCRLIIGYAGEDAVYCGARTEKVARGGCGGFASYCGGHSAALRCLAVEPDLSPMKFSTGFDFRPRWGRAA